MTALDFQSWGCHTLDDGEVTGNKGGQNISHPALTLSTDFCFLQHILLFLKGNSSRSNVRNYHGCASGSLEMQDTSTRPDPAADWPPTLKAHDPRGMHLCSTATESAT